MQMTQTPAQKIEAAIQDQLNGLTRTTYISIGDYTIRVANHGANTIRTDANMYSLVVGENWQSFNADRGRMRTSWEYSNQFYLNDNGDFTENWMSIQEFLDWFEIQETELA